MVLKAAEDFDNTDYDIFSISEWNEFVRLLNKLSNPIVSIKKTIRIISDE